MYITFPHWFFRQIDNINRPRNMSQAKPRPITSSLHILVYGHDDTHIRHVPRKRNQMRTAHDVRSHRISTRQRCHDIRTLKQLNRNVQVTEQEPRNRNLNDETFPLRHQIDILYIFSCEFPQIFNTQFAKVEELLKATCSLASADFPQSLDMNLLFLPLVNRQSKHTTLY